MADPTDIIPIAQARTWSEACAAMVARGRAAAHDQPAQTHAVYSAVRDYGWSVLLAPRLYALLTAWQACQRLEAAVVEAMEVRARVASGVREAAEGDGDASALGPDLLSVRATAYSRTADTVIRAEAEYARARKELERAANRYQIEREELPTTARQQTIRLLEQAWREGDLTTARAMLALGTSAPDDPERVLPDLAAQYRAICDAARTRGDLGTALAATDRIADLQRGVGERPASQMSEAEIEAEIRRAVGS